MNKERKWIVPVTVCLGCGAIFLSMYLFARLSPAKGKALGLGHDKIGVIKIEGVLMDAGEIVEEITRYSDRDDVKAVILRIDSPGGAVVPAQEIYEELMKLRSRKPVLASVGNVAASGGYYVACAADEIIANPGSLTGSIGVISEYPNIEKLMDKIGWKATVLKSGQFKDIGNPMRQMTKEEVQLLQGLIDSIHTQFINAVAEGRRMGVDVVKRLADGRLYTGEEAKEKGLIDRLGNFQYAVERAGTLAGIEGKPVVLYPEEPKELLWKRLFRTVAEWMTRHVFEGYEDRRGFMWTH